MPPPTEWLKHMAPQLAPVQSSGRRLLSVMFASWFPHAHQQHFPKNQFSPATYLHSSWKIRVKPASPRKQGTKDEGNSSPWSCTFHYSHQMFVNSLSSMTLSLGAAELFLPARPSQEAPPILINRIIGYQETLNGFKRLEVMGADNGLEGRCWNNPFLTQQKEWLHDILLPRTVKGSAHRNCKTPVTYIGISFGIISQTSRTNKETDGSGFQRRQQPAARVSAM